MVKTPSNFVTDTQAAARRIKGYLKYNIDIKVPSRRPRSPTQADFERLDTMRASSTLPPDRSKSLMVGLNPHDKVNTFFGNMRSADLKGYDANVYYRAETYKEAHKNLDLPGISPSYWDMRGREMRRKGLDNDQIWEQHEAQAQAIKELYRKQESQGLNAWVTLPDKDGIGQRVEGLNAVHSGRRMTEDSLKREIRDRIRGFEEAGLGEFAAAEAPLAYLMKQTRRQHINRSIYSQAARNSKGIRKSATTGTELNNISERVQKGIHLHDKKLRQVFEQYSHGAKWEPSKMRSAIQKNNYIWYGKGELPEYYGIKYVAGKQQRIGSSKTFRTGKTEAGVPIQVEMRNSAFASDGVQGRVMDSRFFKLYVENDPDEFSVLLRNKNTGVEQNVTVSKQHGTAAEDLFQNIIDKNYNGIITKKHLDAQLPPDWEFIHYNYAWQENRVYQNLYYNHNANKITVIPRGQISEKGGFLYNQRNIKREMGEKAEAAGKITEEQNFTDSVAHNPFAKKKRFVKNQRSGKIEEVTTGTVSKKSADESYEHDLKVQSQRNATLTGTFQIRKNNAFFSDEHTGSIYIMNLTDHPDIKFDPDQFSPHLGNELTHPNWYIGPKSSTTTNISSNKYKLKMEYTPQTNFDGAKPPPRVNPKNKTDIGKPYYAKSYYWKDMYIVAAQSLNVVSNAVSYTTRNWLYQQSNHRLTPPQKQNLYPTPEEWNPNTHWSPRDITPEIRDWYSIKDDYEATNDSDND